MLTDQQKDLWNHIQHFAIDDPSAFVKYSDKLAHSNGWSKDYTARVIEEYKKFIFLCCILPGGASPSKPVDEAWHLHLTYTKNYWKDFCADVLGKEIHHFPSKGGPDENEKHVRWYKETLDDYKEAFDSDAPTDIWIPPDKPSQETELITETRWTYFKFYKKYLYVLFIPFVLILVLYNKVIPFNLDGPQFLVFFISLIVSVSTYLVLVRTKKQDDIRSLINEHYNGDANVFQIARFIYSTEWSMRAAIVDLVARNILQPLRKSRFAFMPTEYRYSSSENNPLATPLLRNFKDDDTIHYKDLVNYYDESASYHAGLFNLFNAVKVKDYWPLIIGAIVELIGIVRIIQGVQNHKPVSYLLTLCFVFVIFFFLLYSKMISKRIVRDEFVAGYQNSAIPNFENAAAAGAFVFLGLSSISAIHGYFDLQRTFSKNPIDAGAASWSSSSGSSCGGSSCGGSSCGGSSCGGGGGCGGGCGGCGGS